MIIFVIQCLTYCVQPIRVLVAENRADRSAVQKKAVSWAEKFAQENDQDVSIYAYGDDADHYHEETRVLCPSTEAKLKEARQILDPYLKGNEDYDCGLAYNILPLPKLTLAEATRLLELGFEIIPDRCDGMLQFDFHPLPRYYLEQGLVLRKTG